MNLVKHNPCSTMLYMVFCQIIDFLHIKPDAVERQVKRCIALRATLKYLLEQESRLADASRPVQSNQTTVPVHAIIHIALKNQRSFADFR